MEVQPRIFGIHPMNHGNEMVLTKTENTMNFRQLAIKTLRANGDQP
jgi:hypothetical protein